jgi:cobalt/nickel transport system permease protein
VVRDRLFRPYHHGTSIIHGLPAGVKLAAAVGCVLLVVLQPGPAWSAYLLIAGALAVIALLSRVPPMQLLLRLALLEPLVIGIAAMALLRPGGWSLFLVMMTKSTLCLACMVLLAATTRFSDLLQVLWRLRMPTLLVTTLALMHRYLFVLLEEMERMQRARRSRTFGSGKTSAWQGSAQVAGLLFVRASERAERVYLAMCARGWKN